MQPKLTIQLVVSFLLAACSNPNKKAEINVTTYDDKVKSEIYQIDPRTIEKNELCISDFAADIEYVSLANDILVGNIIDLKLTGEGIYIVVDNSTGGEGNGHQELFRFDINGKNPVNIGCNGKGPGEYLACDYFAVDETNNQIYINGSPNNVLVYSTNGLFKREFKFSDPKIRWGKMQLLGNNYLFIPRRGLGANTEYLWTIVDTLGNVVSAKKNYTPHFETHLGPRNGTYCFNGKVACWIDYNDTIFTISPDFSYNPSYIITPGEHRLPQKDFPITRDLPERLLEYYSPHLFFETKAWLIGRYNYNGKFGYMFFDKAKHKISNCFLEFDKGIKGGIPNDFDGGLMFTPNAYFTKNNQEYIGGFIQTLELKALVESKEFKTSTPKYPEKKKQLEQLAISLNENDNPVLMLVKLKE